VIGGLSAFETRAEMLRAASTGSAGRVDMSLPPAGPASYRRGRASASAECGTLRDRAAQQRTCRASRGPVQRADAGAAPGCRPTALSLRQRAKGEQRTVNFIKMNPTLRFYLWPPHETHHVISDEFIVDIHRIKLMGNVLEVTFEGQGQFSPEAARAAADKYIAALQRRPLIVAFGVITEDEFLVRTAPPFAQATGPGLGRSDRRQAREATKRARNEILASADEALRRCYDHLQDAREQLLEPSSSGERTANHDLYMAMEVLIERFGGKKQAVAALGKEVEIAKRIANSRRHIKKKKDKTPLPSGDPYELAAKAIRAYERFLLRREPDPPVS